MVEKWEQWQSTFLSSKITADGDCSHEIKRHLLLERKAMTNLDNILKSRDIILLIKVCLVKAICLWELNYKESWVLKNWCFWTVVLEKTLESPLDCKEIQPVHPKGNQSWIFIGRTDTEAETPILWPPDAKNWLIWKDPDKKKKRKKKERKKRPWHWERLKAGERDNWGRDGWMASRTQWTWIGVSSGSS